MAGRGDCAKRKRHYELDDGTWFVVDGKYVPVKNIGQGAYGVVYSALNSETNQKVAIKKIANAFQHSTDALQTLREMTLLRHIKHPNVIALNDAMLPVCKSSFTDVYLVYELMDTDLNKIIRSEQSLSSDHVKYFIFQLLRGLEYLHSANILHRDLKPDNLFINANCDLKIGDFGLATTIKGYEEDFLQEYVVTRWYRAPELLVGCNNYGTSVDIWAAGCIFAELLGRKPIFPGTDTDDQLTRIIKVLGTPHEDDLEFVYCPHARRYIDKLPYSRGASFTSAYPNADELAIDLLKKLLALNPKDRITATQALQHPYFSSIYKFDISENPLAKKALDLNLEDDSMGIAMIRELMWREMKSYHPEAGEGQTYKKHLNICYLS